MHSLTEMGFSNQFGTGWTESGLTGPDRDW